MFLIAVYVTWTVYSSDQSSAVQNPVQFQKVVVQTND
jgi:hypothetical protein